MPPLFPPPLFFFHLSLSIKVISPLLRGLNQGRFCSPQVQNPRLASQAAELTPLSKPLWSLKRNFTFLSRSRGIFLPGMCELLPAPQHWRLSLAVGAEWFHCLLWLYQHCTGEGRRKKEREVVVTVMQIPLSPEQNKAAPFWQLPSQNCMSYLSAALSSWQLQFQWNLRAKKKARYYQILSAQTQEWVYLHRSGNYCVTTAGAKWSHFCKKMNSGHSQREQKHFDIQ